MKMLTSYRVHILFQALVAVAIFALAGCQSCGCGR